MKLLRLLNHPYVYVIALMGLAAGLPVSMWLMGLFMITLPSKWVYERLWALDFKDAFLRFWKNKAAVVLTGVYLIHLLGLLWTEDFDYASNDLRIKLPLLSMPIVLSTMPKLNKLQWRLVLFTFIASCFAGTMHAYWIKFGWVEPLHPVEDQRDIVQFISHIRFALCVTLSIFILGYYLVKHQLKWKLLYVSLILWFVGFLYVLGSPTGFVVLLAGTVVILIYQAVVQRKWWLRLLVFGFLIGLPLSAYFYIRVCIEDYYDVEKLDYADLPTHTVNGEPYFHDLNKRQVENGHYVWVNIAWGELAFHWQQRSRIPFEGEDEKGQIVSGTMIRYLTSKGLTKDSVGIWSLTEGDINIIESGTASSQYDKRNGIRRRIDEIIFEIDAYRNGGNPSWNSVTQRIEFWRAAKGIISQYFWTGVGTGDVAQAFEKQYQEIDSMLEMEVRHRAHNQYLTMFLTFGIFGLLYFIFALFYPMFKAGKRYDYFYVIFLTAALLSFLTEDTLETQAGVTFFTFFNCLFLFGREEGLEG